MNTININRNQYVLITGATSGFGYEFAKLFAKNGYNLVLVARNAERLQEMTDDLKQQFDIEATPVSKDLFEINAAEEIYNLTKEMGITINILVNDAGQGEYGKFAETELARDLDIIHLNIVAVVSLTKYFLKDMVARNEGKILQLGSEVSKSPMPMMAVYAASKAFVLSFSEALVNELKDTNVTITTLMPGASDTDFFRKAKAEDTKTYREKHLAKPEEVAKTGYDAFMKGEERVITGAGAKTHVAIAALIPDSANAAGMRRQMEKSEKNANEGRKQAEHAASKIEREKINAQTRATSGDYP